MRVLLDVDGLLGHFTAGARQWADEIHDCSFTDEQITDYDIMASFGLPNGWPSFIDWLSESCFCRHMPVYPGAVEFVATLREFAEVVAVTSPFVGVRNWEADRREWLYEHFYISPKDVIFAHRKELVRGDVLVDDKPSNVEAFAREPGQTGLLFTQPWNARHLGGWHVRVTGYKEALRKVREWSDAAGELRVRAGA